MLELKWAVWMALALAVYLVLLSVAKLATVKAARLECTMVDQTAI